MTFFMLGIIFSIVALLFVLLGEKNPVWAIVWAVLIAGQATGIALLLLAGVILDVASPEGEPAPEAVPA